MIKVVIDTDIVTQIYRAGQTEAAPRKRFECPHCKAEMAYYNYSPLSCPVCKKGFVDLDKLINEKPYGRIAFFQGKYV